MSKQYKRGDHYPDWESLEALPNEPSEGFKRGDLFVCLASSNSYEEGEVVEFQKSHNLDGVIVRFRNAYYGIYLPFSRLAPLPKQTKENDMKFKQGDIIVSDEGNKRKVLGVCGLAYILSLSNSYEEANTPWTQYELDELGYKLQSDTPKTTLTKAEIAKKFGVDVEGLEISDE